MNVLEKLKQIINKIKEIFSKKDQVKLLEEPSQTTVTNGFDKVWKEKLQISETPKDRFKALLSERGVSLSNAVINAMYNDIFDKNEQIASISYEDKDRIKKINNIMNKKLDSFTINGNEITTDTLQKANEKGDIIQMSQSTYSENSIIKRQNSISGLNYYNDGSHSEYSCISSEEMIKYDPKTNDQIEVSNIIKEQKHQASHNDVMPDSFNSTGFHTKSHVVTARDTRNRNIIIQKVLDENGTIIDQKTENLNPRYANSQELPKDEFNFNNQTDQEQEDDIIK